MSEPKTKHPLDNPPCCGTCLFFEFSAEDEGVCHRYPPSLIKPGRNGQEVDDWRMPLVYSDVTWCGEHQYDPSSHQRMES